MGEPRNPHAIPLLETDAFGTESIDEAHDLVTRNDSWMFGCQVTLGEVQVSTAHAADCDP